MGQPDSNTIFNHEGNHTYRAERLDGILNEIDKRTSGKDIWSTITRTSGLISKIEYFNDAAKTEKSIQIDITRTTGVDNLQYINTVTEIYYNSDGSEDSRVTKTLNRDSNDLITGCDSVFSTTEEVETEC